MATGQKQRAHKTSKGIHGGGGKGRPLSGVEKVLLGGGALRTITRPETKRGKAILAEKGHSPSTDERPKPRRSVKEQLDSKK
jgi:hypothetical protein